MDWETKQEYPERIGDTPREEDEIDHIPADILAPITHAPNAPLIKHSAGHTSPGHVVGRSLHDSPRHHHVEILPNQVLEGHGILPNTLLPGLVSQGSSVSIVDPVARLPGSEPGVDVRRESAKRAYAHLKEDSEIEVVDYDADHVKFQQFHNESFLQFLETVERKPPMKVRWINVAGVSWDVISALALKFQLHPLAVEDVLHSRSVSLSKADYFERHLFLRVVCHALSSKKASPLKAKYLQDDAAGGDSSEEEESENESEEEPTEPVEENPKLSLLRRATRRKRRASKSSIRETADTRHESRLHPLRWMEAAMLLNPEDRRRNARIAKLNALKKKGRVRVMVSNAFLFLFKDGTVISFHQGDRAFGDPIYHRLRHSDTVLRKDPEASLLLQSLLDLIVDQAIQVVDKYGDKINQSETQALLNPNLNLVQTLHVLSADLALRKRTMQPLKMLVYGLRRFDLQRTAAVMGTHASTSSAEGYMSAKTKVYLADISDHVESILSSLDQFSMMTDSLIDFIFNMNAHSTNEQMKRMNVLICIFLPLTLLTGYFGMNFAIMPSVQAHSDLLFWEIALPMMALILPWALWGEIRKVFRYIRKNMLLNRVEKRQVKKVQSAKQAERIRRRTLEKNDKASERPN